MTNLIVLFLSFMLGIVAPDNTPHFNPNGGFVGASHVMTVKDANPESFDILFERLSYKYSDLCQYFG